MIRHLLSTSFYLFLLCNYSFAQQIIPNVKEDRSFIPVVDYDHPEPADSEDKSKRKEKNKRYNDRWFVFKTPPGPKTVGSGVYEEDRLPAIPVSESAVIVTGEILDGKAHLSDDKSFIYSEYKIQVNDILKNNPLKDVVRNSVIEADVWGGFVRYPNGQKIFFEFSGKAYPLIGRRYILFLIAINQNHDYKIQAGYELRNGKVYPLNTLPVYRQFEGAGEADFIKKIRNDIEQTSKTNPEIQ